jgi:hypothetical protein
MAYQGFCNVVSKEHRGLLIALGAHLVKLAHDLLSLPSLQGLKMNKAGVNACLVLSLTHNRLNGQPLLVRLDSPADNVCLLIVEHSQHEGIAEQVAYLGRLLAQKFGEALGLWR